MLFLACSWLFLIRKITIQIESSSWSVYIPIWLLSARLTSFHLQKLTFKKVCSTLSEASSFQALSLSLCFLSGCGKGSPLGNDDESGYVPRAGVKVDNWRVVNAHTLFGCCDQSTYPCTEVTMGEGAGTLHLGSVSIPLSTFPSYIAAAPLEVLKTSSGAGWAKDF